MNWHRDGNGGYVGEHTDHDAHATVKRDLIGGWEVVTYVFGSRVDRKWFARLADAKWHASEVISNTVVLPYKGA